MSAELWSYVALIVAGFLPNELWRVLGLVMARGLDEDSELVILARLVATAIIAGVIAKLVLFPPGALAAIPLAVRLAAVGCGSIAFVLSRQSVFAGVAAGEAVLILAGYFAGSH
jgi:hypothetical protein